MNLITLASQTSKRTPHISAPSMSRLMITTTTSSSSTTQPPMASASVDTVMNLDDLVREILTRLPAKKLFSFTLVSKRWNYLITDPTLISTWKYPTFPTSLYVRPFTGVNIKIYCIPLGKSSPAVKPTLRSLDFAPNPMGIKINQSCNGLLLCSTMPSHTIFNYLQLYFVYNPTIKEFILIPTDLERTDYVTYMSLAFQSPHEYKIVAVVSPPPYLVHYIEIYEPEKSLYWRDPMIRFPPVKQNKILHDQSVCANGVVYWPSNGPGGVVYFRIKEEKIVWLPEVPLPSSSTGDVHYFGECGGRLRMVRSGSMWEGGFDLLELATDYSAWYVKYRVNLRHSSWYMLSIVCGEGDDEESVLFYASNEVVSYNLKKETERKICDLKLTQFDLLASKRPYYVHSCMETFLCP